MPEVTPFEQVTAHAGPTYIGVRARPEVRGKFLFVDGEKLYIRGVTYGPFQPDAEGCEYPACAEQEFALMAANGVNAIRLYTAPPMWLLDAARRHGLWVMVGLPWEQHVAFLGNARTAAAIETRVRDDVRSCGAHPAILCYTIGNEIPASIVRWHGRRRIEAFLRRLYRIVKAEDPNGLVTYVNFPPTEYLQLDFLDFISFNVYLERQDRLEAYLARLQSLAENKPVLMAEVGLDSRRNGEAGQAAVLDWQVRTVFAAGCAGVFVFAWTDEWWRGGFNIEDWDFGLTTRSRSAKPALHAIKAAFRDVPFPADEDWPSISVVICSYNGQRTIRQTLEEVLRLDYPNFEIIVVNDGSTDDTPVIAASFPAVRLVSTPNGGLSAARNVGMRTARGEIVAYIDDDAYPDPQWLRYLGMAFRRTSHVAIGGPNIPPAGDGLIAECVGNAPGSPIHVMLTDDLAEHIPGCNFAVRRRALEEIGGFDPLYRVAGDDVDTCWRLQERGGTLGFAPAAVVWHHRRNSLKAYWRQQKGYGKAEALLERKWPGKYNDLGHMTWQGRVYGPGVLRAVGGRSRVYGGVWGSNLFQRLYDPSPGAIQTFMQMPEWYVVVAVLFTLTMLGFTWYPLLGFAPLFVAAVSIPVAQAVASASVAHFPGEPRRRLPRAGLIALTTLLFLIQPAARLWGRIAHGLTPWRRKAHFKSASPIPQEKTIWSEEWKSSESWIASLEAFGREWAAPIRGGDFDEWDLQFRGGVAGSTRINVAVEEHGAGKQLVRIRMRPVVSRFFLLVAVLLSGLGVAAGLHRAGPAAVCLLGLALVLAGWAYRDCAIAAGAVTSAYAELRKGQPQ